ncbi:MAG: hypothetical protein HZY75_04035 [Nocardioidaceae bacterium]|nr:MAG: hypothetical protein HZY75_04035 [Nocardioidaceae bacterium]
MTRRELAMATCEVFSLDPDLLDFGPPPDEARLPAPVPYDTSMAGEATMVRLGARTYSIYEQIEALKREVEEGRPMPLS